VRLYGMPPREWYQRGVRILARTCLEAVKDPLGNKIGSDLAEVVSRATGDPPIGIVDPFAGSCNGLYSMLRHLPGSKGIGFELDAKVFELTSRNIAHLKAPIQVLEGSYKDLVRKHRHPSDHLVVVFLGPPWGDALKPETGLHLDQTKPPILEIVRDFETVYGSQAVLYATEVHEVNEPTALKAVQDSGDGLQVPQREVVDRHLAEFLSGGHRSGVDQVPTDAYRTLLELFDRQWLGSAPRREA